VGRTVCCIGPEVHLHDLLGLGPGSRDARSAGATDRVLHALARGSVDAVVIAAPGRPMPGLGHYLELGSDVILYADRDVRLNSTQSLALLACWGARVLGQSSGDPLTLATIALARGSRQILVT
jgi:hypothetical protein